MFRVNYSHFYFILEKHLKITLLIKYFIFIAFKIKTR